VFRAARRVSVREVFLVGVCIVGNRYFFLMFGLTCFFSPFVLIEQSSTAAQCLKSRAVLAGVPGPRFVGLD